MLVITVMMLQLPKNQENNDTIIKKLLFDLRVSTIIVYFLQKKRV